MKKQLVIGALVLTILGTGVATSGKIFAQTPTSTSQMSTLVQKIADKFGLKASDVQAVFDQERTERQAEMEAKYETQLTKYVTDGKITDTQKQLILAKHKELATARQTEMQSMQGMTAEQRKAAMESKKTIMDAERTAIQEWAAQNGIDVKYVLGGFGMRGGHGGGPGGMKHNPDATPTQ